MSLANEAENAENIMAVTMANDLARSKIIEAPRLGRRQRVANGEIRGGRLDGVHEPSMRVRLNAQ